MGRHNIYIDKNIFENLCKQFNTLDDIANIFNCSQDTIERWCKRTYKQNFADIYKKFSAYGRSSLRSAQFKTAIKNENVTMQIFLGKQYLGQSDKVETEVRLAEISPEVQAEVDEIIKGCGNDGEINTTTSD